MVDRIDKLPRTAEKPSLIDTKIMNDLFNEVSTENEKMGWKAVASLSLLFILLNLPVVDVFLKEITKSEVMVLCIKAVAFVVILTLIKLN